MSCTLPHPPCTQATWLLLCYCGWKANYCTPKDSRLSSNSRGTGSETLPRSP
ncbi:hypothetical protein DM02DRAFT_613756 [Periconia macrospinosa]|uniref:Uncharacterized protein n=1 Tax=Periconia macrospinosa TaxID=97972 RepID=A0A2V1DST3_9PLEO|nr:hypothetical protein DM02DRAFT_613756 [Periconia macrospinosa]